MQMWWWWWWRWWCLLHERTAPKVFTGEWCKLHSVAAILGLYYRYTDTHTHTAYMHPSVEKHVWLRRLSSSMCCEFTIGLFITLAFCALNEANQASSARMAWQRVMDGFPAAAPDVVAHRPPTAQSCREETEFDRVSLRRTGKRDQLKQDICERYSEWEREGLADAMLISSESVCQSSVTLLEYTKEVTLRKGVWFPGCYSEKWTAEHT